MPVASSAWLDVIRSPVVRSVGDSRRSRRELPARCRRNFTISGQFVLQKRLGPSRHRHLATRASRLPSRARYHGPVQTASKRFSGASAARGRALAAASDDAPLASPIPFVTFLIFLSVSLLNLGVRWPWLGVLRPTVLFVGVLLVMAFAVGAKAVRRIDSRESRMVGLLLLYVLVSLPLVTWPGSVIKNNLDLFVRATMFLFFVAIFVDSPRRLGVFLTVYLGLQLFRCLEPLYLHQTSGYWGEKTHLGDGVFMGRLAGAPSDIIGANGLGFLIVTTLPFLYFWCRHDPKWWKLLLVAALVPPLLYALTLTSSRSGVVGLVVLVLAISFFVKRRLLFVGGTLTILFFAAMSLWSADQVARFAGLVGGGGAGGATAKGRIDGIMSDINVWLHNPMFGHGLGTSYEANVNLAGAGYISHNLYSEALVTLGILGGGIFVAFLYAMFRSSREMYSLAQSNVRDADPAIVGVLSWLPQAMISLLAMCAVFSLSSYGVMEYYWYLFAGLIAATLRMSRAATARAGVARAHDPRSEPILSGPGVEPGGRRRVAPSTTRGSRRPTAEAPAQDAGTGKASTAARRQLRRRPGVHP